MDVWEHDREGKQPDHHAWRTDVEAPPDHAASIAGLGRSRWQIETEHVHGHKTHGYELEHNSGPGKQSLSMMFSLRTLLAGELLMDRVVA